MKVTTNWKELIEKWDASGLSKEAFCKQESVPYQSFLYHVKRSFQKDDKGAFQQVLLDARLAEGKIDYYFCDGRRVSFPVSTSKEMIRFILSL